VAHVLDGPVVQHVADRHRSRHQAEVPVVVVLRFCACALNGFVCVRAIDTIMQWQHPDGGFGGGPGQAAHSLATYAAVCSLAIVGRPGPEGGWDQIHRCAG
jgi:prenyltransferase beta subunit